MNDQIRALIKQRDALQAQVASLRAALEKAQLLWKKAEPYKNTLMAAVSIQWVDKMDAALQGVKEGE